MIFSVLKHYYGTQEENCKGIFSVGAEGIATCGLST